MAAPKAQRQFDFVAGVAARDEGVKNAKKGAGDDWILETLTAVRRVSRAQPEFTTDDLWVHVDPPREPRAMGAAMVHARKLGLCDPTDRTKRSSRVKCHARPLRVWKSLLFQE